MGVLNAFERRLGGLVEGAFAKVFKGDVQPVEIAGALSREADQRRNVVSEDKVLVPNDYVVELGDHDYQRLVEWAEPLSSELAAMVREHAAERGYSFVGPVKVALEHLPDIGTGTFRIRSGVAAGAKAPGSSTPRSDQATSRHDVPGSGHSPAVSGRPRLILAPSGSAQAGPPRSRSEQTTFFLTRPVSTIGRAADCDLRLDDPGVSRHHAELRCSDGEVEVVDLGSTNGIRVNGSGVSQVRLHDGDRVEIGSTPLTFHRDQG